MKRFFSKKTVFAISLAALLSANFTQAAEAQALENNCKEGYLKIIQASMEASVSGAVASMLDYGNFEDNGDQAKAAVSLELAEESLKLIEEDIAFLRAKCNIIK